MNPNWNILSDAAHFYMKSRRGGKKQEFQILYMMFHSMMWNLMP